MTQTWQKINYTPSARCKEGYLETLPGSPPHILQEQEYRNLLSLGLAGALKKVFKMLGMEYEYGTMALTARRQPMVSFEVQEMEANEETNGT